MGNHVTVNRSRSRALRSRTRRWLQLCGGFVLCIVACLPVTARPQAAHAPLTAQDLIDAAAPWGVVVLEDLTYAEQLVIDKNLTLIGAGSSTVIRAPETPLVGYPLAPGGDTYYPVIYVHDAARVTIQNLRVDGAGRGNDHSRFAGIVFHNAGGRVDTVEVVGVHDTPYSTAAHGTALYAYANSGTTRDLYVTYCDFSGFQKNGAAFWGADLTAQVSYNTISGRGPIDSVAQNGIVIGSGVAGIVGPSNTLSGYSYTPDGTAATGILIYANDAAVFHNAVVDSEVGIYLFQGGGDIYGNTVTAGDGAAEPWGIVATVGAITRSAGGVFSTPSIDYSAQMLAPTAGLTITIAANSLIGDGANVDSTGIETDIGSDAGDVALLIEDNETTGWGEGVVIYRAAAAGAVEASSFVLRGNSIEGNLTYGMYAVGFITSSVDAQQNWWGHNTGPYDESPSDGFFNPNGQGDAVSDGVNYLRWLRRAHLPLMFRDG